MANSLAITTLIIGFIGTIILLFRRVPELVRIDSGKEEEEIDSKVKESKSFSRKKSFNDFLKKTLIRFKVFTQKAENKTSSIIKKIGKDSSKEGENYSDEDYWNKLKK